MAPADRKMWAYGVDPGSRLRTTKRLLGILSLALARSLSLALYLSLSHTHTLALSLSVSLTPSIPAGAERGAVQGVGESTRQVQGYLAHQKTHPPRTLP